MVLKRRAEDRKDWQKLRRPGVLYLHLSRLLKEEEAQTSVTREFEQVPGKMGGLFTNVCRSCAAIEVVRPLSQPRYALFTIDVVRPPTWRTYDVTRTTSHVRNFSLIYGKHSDDVIEMSGMLCIYGG